MKQIQSHIPRISLLVVLSAMYAATLAPGLSWANGGADGGDLISAAATGGIPHPTGYPLYVLLARLFQLLPLGSLAFRTNLMSALATLLGALLVYELVIQSIAQDKNIPAWPGALAAGYAFGLAPLVWSQAVITEVYALQGLLILAVIYAYIQPGRATVIKQKRLDRWRGLLLGLAIGNHLTTLFLVPLALLLGSLQRAGKEDNTFRPSHPCLKNIDWNWAALRRQLIFFVIGLSVYLSLPLRALAKPPVNWGNPVTVERFWWLVSGQLYQAYYFPENLVGLWEQLQAWAALLLNQFGLSGLLLGLIGLFVFGKASRLYVLTTWTALAYSIFALIYRAADSYVYLIPVYLAFAIWIGMGISSLAREYQTRFSWFGMVLGLLMTGYFISRVAITYRQVDASQDMQAENFVQEVLTVAPEDALIFANGDKAAFSLWYYHFALEERRDLVVIAADLLHFDWYQEMLRTSYPSLTLPGPLPYPETISLANPLQANCYVQFTTQAEIECRE